MLTMTNTPMTREAFEEYVKKEYEHLNLARSTINADEYSSATVCGFWEYWLASEANQQAVISEKDKQIAELVEALEEAKSVMNSINRAEMYKLTVEDDDEPVFYQRKEWVDWAYNEILPIVTSAIAKVKGK